MRGAVPVVLAAVLLAGCSEDVGPAHVIVVESGVNASAEAQEIRPTDQAPQGTAILAGVVIDEAYHAVAGATVRLPGMDLEKVTGSEGRFAFDGLWPGPYFLEADAQGHRALSSVVEVKNSVTEVRIELVREPSDDPYHVTEHFRGLAELSHQSFIGGPTFCSECTFTLVFPAPADTLVLDLERDGGELAVRLRDTDGRQVHSGYERAPATLHLNESALHGGTRFYLELQPVDLVPQTDVEFEVFSTSFHNGPAPHGWSIREAGP